MIKTIVINKLNDPGHGWYSVSLKDLKKLNITISSLYQKVIVNNKQTRIYLEEDCEYKLLFDLLESRKIKIKIKDFHTNKQSRVRNFNIYNLV